ncbi:hypothetical protein ABTJ52_23410, partial [Acinetobacter baumannii]
QIDSGHKREARTRLAESQRDEARLGARLRAEEVRRDAYLKLQRVRQLTEELGVLGLISKQLARFATDLRRLPRLAP